TNTPFFVVGVAAVMGFGGGGVTMVGMDDGSGGYDDGGGGVASAVLGTKRGVTAGRWREAAVARGESGVGDRIDRETRAIFGFAGKRLTGKLSGSGSGWPTVAGGRLGWRWGESFDIESDLKEIEFLLYQDIDSSLKDSIDQSNLANLADNFVDTMPEMFTDEYALNYSSPSMFDEYDAIF
nr:hypothetical protein [Tanacetum cinerariifolium]